MQDLTTGPVSRHLLRTTSFMLVTMVFQTLYFLVDLYWVGRLGKEAVAAVGIAGNLMFVVLAITMMLGVGTTALISHASGQRDQPRATRTFNQAIGLSVIVGLVYLIAAMSVRGPYARALSADATTAKLAGDYLAWFIPAMAMQFPMVAMGSALRGTGNFKPGMVVQTATVILNLVLAPFLIFGWGTGHPIGVAGAAIATFIAVGIGTTWLVFYFLPKSSYLHFLPSTMRPDMTVWRRLLGIGLPSGAEFALVGVYVFIVYSISRPFGAAAQAGFGIGMRVIQAGFMPVVALGFAVAPVAGQNYGAGLPHRVRETFRTAVIAAASIMLLFALLCHIAPAAMIGVFSSDPDVIAMGEEYLRIVSWNYVASGIVFVASSTFQAIGNTLPSLLASLTRLLLIGVPALLLARLPNFHLRWVWYLTVVSVAIQAVMVLLLLRREFRLRLTPSVPHPEHDMAADALPDASPPEPIGG